MARKLSRRKKTSWLLTALGVGAGVVAFFWYRTLKAKITLPTTVKRLPGQPYVFGSDPKDTALKPY